MIWQLSIIKLICKILPITLPISLFIASKDLQIVKFNNENCDLLIAHYKDLPNAEGISQCIAWLALSKQKRNGQIRANAEVQK
jgi:hypothetical protein